MERLLFNHFQKLNKSSLVLYMYVQDLHISIVMFFVKGTYRWFYKFFNRIVLCKVGMNMDIVLKNIFVTDFFVRNIRMISKERA